MSTRKPKYEIDLPEGRYHWKGVNFEVPNTRPAHLNRLIDLGFHKLKEIKPKPSKEEKDL
ncbi:MAG: hypothetical protein LPK47_02670 [Bacteroidota bacterium]|mgnify:FL=1|nr:hypothetical protein [Bacteroidota bacterium]